VIIFDVDHFKNFNDTHGHLAGDRVLRGIGDILKQHVREGDIAARFGGEEFVVLLTEADRDSALQVARRIRMAVERSKFDGLLGDDDAVTISGGVAAYPSDGTQLDELIELADLALYRAKESGRNTVLSAAPGEDILEETEEEDVLEEIEVPMPNASDDVVMDGPCFAEPDRGAALPPLDLGLPEWADGLDEPSPEETTPPEPADEESFPSFFRTGVLDAIRPEEPEEKEEEGPPALEPLDILQVVTRRRDDAAGD
jgi:diguanylate cyclase (GGDEF)-like protein